MNWSKEQGVRFEEQLAADEAKRWRRAWITTGTFLLLLIVAIVALVRMMRGDPQQLLEASLTELTAANDADEISLKLEHAAKARDAAEQAIGLGADNSSANLLLSAALTIRLDDPNFLIDERNALEAAKGKIDLEDCRTRELIQAGLAYFFAGDNPRADELLTAAYERNQLRAEVLDPLIQVRYDRGSEETVLELSAELAKLEPNNCLPWVARSYVFEDRQNLEPLVDTYRELLKRSCEDKEQTRWKLTDRLIELGLASDAEAEWNQLVAEAPDLAKSKQITLAKLLYLQGKQEETRQLVAEVLKQRPNHPEAILLRGQIALNNDRPDEAVADLKKLVELDPTHPNAHYILGQAYAKAGMREEAERELEFHGKLTTALSRLHGMERYAAKNVDNAAIRLSIAQKYDDLGLTVIGDYWRQQAWAIQNK